MHYKHQSAQVAPVNPIIHCHYSNKEDDCMVPFKLRCKSIGFDGNFYCREWIIWVLFEGIGYSLIDLWNHQGQTSPKHLGFYPRYEYTALKD